MKNYAITSFLLATTASASSAPFEQPSRRLRGAPQAQGAAPDAVRHLQHIAAAHVLQNSTNGCVATATAGANSYMPTSFVSKYSVADGSLEDWGIPDPPNGIPMYEAGNDATKMIASHAYLNWDCRTGTLCVAVKAIDGVVLDTTDISGNFWFKDYGFSGNEVKMTPKDNNGKVSTITTNGDGTGNNDGTGDVIAWEACYEITSTDCRSAIEIHANFKFDNKSATTSTGKDTTGKIGLDLNCPCPKITAEVNQMQADEVCKVNKCYQGSECSDGKCEYGLTQGVDFNCCEVDEDCYTALGETCVMMDGDETGTCTAKTGNPDTGTEATSPNTGPTDASVPECTSHADCSLPDDSSFSPHCMQAVCNPEGKCDGATLKPVRNQTCPINIAEEGNFCYADADVCSTAASTYGQCVPEYKTSHEECTDRKFQFGCTVQSCQAKTLAETGTVRYTCQDDVTKTEAKNTHSCEFIPDEDKTNACFAGSFCKSGTCDATYQDAGHEGTCGLHQGDGCLRKQCQPPGGVETSRTICADVSLYEGTGEAPACPDKINSDTGLYNTALEICDKGAICTVDGTCNNENWYIASEEKVCRSSNGDCDMPDVCDGSGADCSGVPDVKYGSTHTCRAACVGDCAGDVIESCPTSADEDSCPPNVIVQDQAWVVAGQHHNAGEATVSVTEVEEGGKVVAVKVSYAIELAEGWGLQDINDPIKLHLCDQDPPPLSPGQYDYKFGRVPGTINKNEGWEFSMATGLKSFTFTKHFDRPGASDDGDRSFILKSSFHFDVTDGVNSETAWLMTAPAATSTSRRLGGRRLTENSMTLQPKSFYRKATRKGPPCKKNCSTADVTASTEGDEVGWGQWAELRVCDYDGVDAPNTEVDSLDGNHFDICMVDFVNKLFH